MLCIGKRYILIITKIIILLIKKLIFNLFFKIDAKKMVNSESRFPRYSTVPAPHDFCSAPWTRTRRVAALERPPNTRRNPRAK